MVIQADFVWNLVGVLVMLLGLLSYKYTRERILPYSRIRRVAIVATAVILFSGMFVLNRSLESQYIYCYLAGGVHYPRFDCANILDFPGVLFGVVTTILGSIGFAALTLSTISLTVALRQRLPAT